MRRTTIAALSAALLVAAPVASAHDQKVDGVRADIKRGTLEVKGGDQSNTVALRLAAGNPAVIQVDVGDDQSADFSFARAAIDAINVKMGDGDDVVQIDDSHGTFTDTIPTTISGGDGNDTLEGGQGDELFRGGEGNDFVDGGKGADTAYLGEGDDTFQWDPGEGSDVIEGQDGTDTMLFNGANGNETVNMSANGGRLTFFRQPGAVTMDTDGVEVVDFNALGGQDNITLNDLSGTDVTQTNLDLASSIGGSASDGVADTVTVNGTDGDDNIAVNANGSGGADVTGLHNTVSVAHADHANPADVLAVNTLGGDDHVATAGIAGVLQLLVDGAPSS
jgi:Ca2+-binding RTX toxin-like protein